MSTSILYRPQGIVLSSALRQIPVSTDSDYVDVRIEDRTGKTIFNERLYACDGSILICDTDRLLEISMRDAGDSFADFSLYAGDDAHTYHVLFCDRVAMCPDPDSFFKENFLSTLSMRRIPPGASCSVFLFAQKGESLSFSLTEGSETVFFNDGVTARYSGVFELKFSPRDKYRSFSVRCGGRYATFFVDDSLKSSDAFAFRNCFNVPEYLYLPMQTTVKTETSGSEASVSGRRMLYNRSTERSYESVSHALTSDEADWIDQFFSSHEVWLLNNNDADPESDLLLPVIITDSTCEICRSAQKPASVKFSWTFSDMRPVISLTSGSGIFTSQFNPVFI